MTDKQFRYIENIVRNDAAQAIDNLARANAQKARMPHTADEKYGHSDQTLNQIIEGYQKWRTEAEGCLDALRSMYNECKR
jgi:hypothetical protein